jgi:hypothetical protein
MPDANPIGRIAQTGHVRGYVEKNRAVTIIATAVETIPMSRHKSLPHVGIKEQKPRPIGFRDIGTIWNGYEKASADEFASITHAGVG